MKTKQLYLCFLLFAIGFSTIAQNPFTEMLNNPATRAIIDADVPARDQVINDDLIVVGSACIGQDCVNGESFGFDTFRMKENNLRMHFDDTSTSSSFPRNDWRFTFNDSSNGGASYFSVDDATAGRQVFRVDAGAPANSLRVDAQGDIGIGTANPVLELHIADGDTPTMRLEQNGSSGFTAQTWDIAGNETNFFIRDVSNGSKLPFKIRPNAATGTMVLGAQANVGIGVGSGNPDSNASLDLKSTTQGLLFNRMTTAERTTFGASLTASDHGMAVYDTDLDEIIYWMGTDWKFSDNQKLNVFTLSGNDLQISLVHDGVPTQSVDLTSFKQKINQFDLSGTTLRLSLEGDGDPPQTVDLSSLAAPFQTQIDRQQAIIDRQQAQINDLISRMEAKEACGCYEGQSTSPRADGQLGNGDSKVTNDRAYLSQNIPNPFDNTTTIGYFVPFIYSEANIVISNITGQILENRKIQKFGKGSIIVDKNRMQTAIYFYSLFVDGKKIDTKRMVVE